MSICYTYKTFTYFAFVSYIYACRGYNKGNNTVIILDNSGIDLGLITWVSYIKMFLFTTLIANLILPANLPLLISFMAILGLSLLTAIVIGTVESAFARFRMTHVFEFIFIMSITALLILALVTYRLYGN